MTEPDWKDDVRSWFSTRNVAGKWDDMYAKATPRLDEHNFRRRRDFAVSLVERQVPAKGRILDLGCGAGAIMAGLQGTGHRPVGLDYAPDMLGFARQRLEAAGVPAPLIRGDAGRLPFRDGLFDCVLCIGVISYQRNYRPVLTEIHRILRPGGLALVTFRNVLNPVLSDPWEAAKGLGRLVLRGEAAREEGLGRRLPPREVRTELTGAGLVPLRFEGIGLGPYRFAGRRPLSEAAAIRVSDWLTGVLRTLGAGWLVRWSADVSMFVCRRPEDD